MNTLLSLLQALGIIFFSSVGYTTVGSLSVSQQTPIPVLLYHYVENITDTRDTIRQSLNIRPNTFEKQITTLLDAGYTFLTMAEVSMVLNGIVSAPAKAVVLTFDDGYRDFYTDVFPILKKYHAKATAYIVPGFLGRHNYMTFKEFKEVAASGLVEIGAHTMYHPNLKNMTYKIVHDEIWGSKTELESMISKPVVSFAYPYGSFDEQSRGIAERVGFSSAVTTVEGLVSGSENRFLLPRVRPGGRYGESLISFLEKEGGRNVWSIQ